MPKRGKFISKNQITGQTAINLIERFILEMGYTWTPTSGATEAGIDGIIEIRDPAVSGGAKVEENRRFEIPVAAARKSMFPDEAHELT